MQFDRKDYSNEILVDLYKNLVLSRMIEEKMLVLLRQGKISKWFSGIGQEAISVGATLALQPDEWIMPLHRNLGVFTSRKMPLHKLFMQWQGAKEGYSKGRERSFHFGSKEHRICGMISHLGPQLAVAAGAALACTLKSHATGAGLKVALAFTGEGATSEGDFHEALNVAVVWDVPVIFIIENNGYGLSTPVNEQYRCKNLTDKGAGYGMESVQIDGNNVLTVYDTLKGVREYCLKNRKPYLIECLTFRMRGHEEASGTKYIPKEMFTEWYEKDPIKNYERYLTGQAVLSEWDVAGIRNEIKNYIESELSLGSGSKPVVADADAELKDMYAPITDNQNLAGEQEVAVSQPKQSAGNFRPSTNLQAPTPKRFIDAIKDGLYLSMKKYPELILMGQDIAEYGGAFKITEGFLEEFGKERVRNTPLCESAIIGIALGLSLEGYKSVVEMQFADFVSVGFNQIVNNLAKIYYRWGQNADVVIRMPAGGGINAGPFHSQSNEAWFVHTPGLKVAYPSTAEDAKGLLIAAINDPGPVLFFEHKALYRSVHGEVPDNYYETEIGKARHVRTGSDISIITYGAGVHWATDLALAKPELSPDILDLRTLLPLDHAAIRDSVRRTGKVLVLHEDTLTGGIGAEISAWISEHCFEWLDAPVMRCASLDTAVPFNAELEKHFLAKSRLDGVLKKLMDY